MNVVFLAWRYLWSRPMAAVLNVLLLALGLASMTFLVLVSDQLKRALDRDLAGIDVVVGAKGSPMQLILSGVLHIDAPPGNVPLAKVHALRQHPMVHQIIPISLGDSFEGYRIVGTTPDYVRHYQAKISQGRVWERPMEVVLGASVARALGMQLGQTFAGSHGMGRGGQAHANTLFRVVGILAVHGGVVDRLILTDTVSVWQVHEDHEAGEHHHKKDKADAKQDVTMALVSYKTPMAALSFPRYVNTQTDMQAAAPALEISRLLHMFGMGTDVLHAYAAVLLLTAGLSVFIGLWSAVRERRSELALLRMLGASPIKLVSLLFIETMWLGLLATVLGLLLGQAFTAGLAYALALDKALLIGGMAWPPQLWVIPGIAMGVATLSAVLPMLEAYRVSVMELLNQP